MPEVNGNGVKFWMKVAGIAFGLWAIMLPITAYVIEDGIHDIGEAVKAEISANSAKHSEYDKELARLQAKDEEVLRRLDVLEAKVNGK